MSFTVIQSSPTPVPTPGILAEAVTFDPGTVVAVLLVLAFLGLASVAVVVGITSGYLSGRDAGRRRATTAWHCCVVVEVLAVLLAICTLAPVELHLVVWAALGSSVAAHLTGRAVREPRA